MSWRTSKRRGLRVAGAVARLACTLYWFNPMVWLAARRLRAESGARVRRSRARHRRSRAAYADLLVQIARESRQARVAWHLQWREHRTWNRACGRS
jgi:beta-lactamase regulating signal transducer with metallopeptidase domain